MAKATKTQTATAVTQEPQNNSLPLEYDVRINSLRNSSAIKGIASVTLNGQFAVRNVSIVEGKNGLFVSLPSNKLQNGEYNDVCFPCTTEARATFDKAVLDAYKNVLTNGLDNQNKESAAQLPVNYDVRIQSQSFGGSALRGQASVSINNQFAIRKVSIMESSKGLFVSLPGFKANNGEFRDHCFPCTKESRAEFDKAVLDAYRQAITQNQAAGQGMEAPNPFESSAYSAAPMMQM